MKPSGRRIHGRGRVMLKLRQIEISGFKSFVDRTKIEIRDDLLIVVGPNGSGKSNVADCILWAIGEQSAKSLRGSKMQDVIFHGTKKRPAAGSAEVFLSFEKEDGQKVKVGRRLNRSGDSSYLIDDNQVRLKDIHEFCYRNNISVQGSYLVEQGRVEKMLSLSPQERKLLFEEVAGIAHYKENRKSAESKLQATQNNLLRLNDIILEVESEQAELKKQALKAERYIRLQDELNLKRRSVFGRGLQELKARKGLLDEELALFYDEREKRSANLSTLESGLEASRLRKSDEESAFTKLTGTLHELALSKEKKESENKRRFDQIFNAKDRIRQIDEDHEKLVIIEKERKKSLVSLETRKAESGAQREVIDGRLEKASRSLESLKNKLDSILNEIELKRKASFSFAEERSSKKSAFIKIGEELRRLDESEARHKRELESLAGQRERAEEALVGEEAVLLQKNNRFAEKEIELAKVQEEMEAVIKQVAGLTRELSACEKNIASYDSRIKVLSEQEKLHKSKAKDILEKKDKALEESKLTAILAELPHRTLKALELIMGEALLGYRLDDSKRALSLIDSVKDDVKERVAFIALDLSAERKIPKEDLKPYKSFAGFVDEMEGFPGWLKPHIRKTARFTDKNDAVSFAKKFGLPAIVDESVVVNPEGWIFGGPSKELAIPLLKLSKEIEETRKQLKAEQATISGFKEQLASVRKHEAVLSSKEKTLSAEKEKLQAEVQQAGLSKQKAEAELKRINSNEDLQRSENGYLKEQRQEYETEKEKLETRLKRLEKDVAETDASLSMLVKDESNCRQELDKAQEELTLKRLEEKEWDERNRSLESELLNLTTSISEVVSTRTRLEDEKSLKVSTIKKLETGILDEEKSLSEVLSEITETIERSRNYEDAIKTLEDELAKSEKLVKEARETLAEVQSEISEREKELATVVSDHKNLIERFASYFEEEWEELAGEWAGSPRMSPEERESAFSQLLKLEKRLTEMGPQNLLAKDDYDKVSHRADFLKTQKKDVETAVSELEETIRKANDTIKARYIEAYEAVNKNFTELFKVVFEGGEAYLKLEDPENPLESGIDIFAQPQGKKVLLNIQLSGGESALVALTLLFAILSYKPQPFFLLDEVDAPLDDANIEKVLSKLLLQFSQKTQFIVISHNKRTMALGDAIYGVTMEEHGISKVVSVSLREVSS
jgi:chromosome segregation protein